MRPSARTAALAAAIGVLLGSATAVLPATGTGSATLPAAAAEVVDCPRAAAPNAKPAPTAPPKDSNAAPIGGEGMDTPGLAVPAGAPEVPTTISAASWVVADLDTGDVLGACAPHARSAPASTLKLLTALTALPKLDPKQVATVTEDDLDIESGSSAVGLVANGEYSVETLALGLFLVSGNDAANTLARLAGGDKGRAGTIEAMNAQAARLGANDTTAVNANGLDDPEQWTSSYDLALIARAAFAREDIRRYTATRTAQIPGQPPKFPQGFQIQNDNKLLQEYEGAFGGKTGFTDLARHTFVGVAERGGRRLVVTLMRGEIQPERPTEQAADLLDWGFSVDEAAGPVGTLVEPKNDDKQGKAPAPGGTNALAGRAAGGSSSLSLITGVAGVVALVVVLGLLVLRRRRIVLARNRNRRRDRQRDRAEASVDRARDPDQGRERGGRRSAAYSERTAYIPARAQGRRPAEPETAHRDTAHRETAHRETAHRETAHRSTAYREARRRENGHRENGHRETADPASPHTDRRTHRRRRDIDDETQPLAPVRRPRFAEADTEPRPLLRTRRSGPSVGVVVVPGPEPRRSRPRR